MGKQAFESVLAPSAVSRVRIAGVALVIIAMAIVASSSLYGQDLTARLQGDVSDETGARVPGAAVTLTNELTNATQETFTNDVGLYVFPRVLQGTYRIIAELTGFRRAVVEGVIVEVRQAVTVDLVLELGDVSETVVVSARETQTIINTTTAEISTVVNQRQIQTLPLQRRDPTEFALMQPGVTGSSVARTASVNGTRGTFNNFTLDGINNQDNFIRTDAFFGVIPLKESFIEEFSITTANSGADAVLGASQTHMVTRSGSNDLHGQLFYFQSNDALNANTFFNNASGIEKERTLNHQYGFNFGGKIIENKLFFFVDYEEEQTPATASVVRQVMTSATRQGNFTYLATNGQPGTVNLLTLAGVAADPKMTSFIDQTPLPNDTATGVGDGVNIQGFRFNNTDAADGNWFVLRMDYELNTQHRFTGTFYQFKLAYPVQGRNSIGPVFPNTPGAGQDSTRRLGSYSWQSSFLPTLNNELRFGFQWAPGEFFNAETFPDGYILTWPTILDNPVQDFLGQGRNSPIWEIHDNASWVKGNHTFQFGGGFRNVKVDQFGNAGIIPDYTIGFGVGNPSPISPGMFPGGISGNDFNNASDILAVLGGFVDEGRQSFNVTSRTSGFVDGATQRRILKQKFFNLYAGDI